MEKRLNFINGEFREPESRKYLDKVDPATGEIFAQVADSNEVDVALAVQGAHKAFLKWRETAAADRSKILYKVAELIELRAGELAESESRDTGKPIHLAKNMDMARASANFRFFAGAILHHREMATDVDGKVINYTMRQPLGVAGLISPWNLPLYLLSWKIAPAIAVGNAAVCKPSEFTPSTANLLAEILLEAGLPPGVVNIIHGQGAVAGAALTRHPGVPLISFTGGTATGEKISAMAAPFFKKLSLELGGKNATIVLKDAPLKKVVPSVVRSSFLNQGEICLCGSKILVQEDIYEEFVQQLVEEVRALKVGDPQEESTFMGPLIHRAHFDKVVSAIAQAKREGGKILVGDEPLELPQRVRGGFFVRPTVIADLTNCSDIHQTEIFGPVVTVSSVKYPHEAVKWANNSPYGLSASIWTQDISKAHKLAQDLDVGTVWINTWLNRDLRVPFGGVKASGLGREGGEFSIDFYTEVKNVCVQL